MTHHIRLLAAVALLALAADGVIAYWNINALIAAERSLTSSHTRLNALESTLSMVKDAETGQRGFLLTGDEEYLAPYNDASAGLDGSLARLRTQWPDELGAIDRRADRARRRASAGSCSRRLTCDGRDGSAPRSRS